MFDIHSKADPVTLTFVSPVSAYHASVAFTAWLSGDGAKYEIYDVVVPNPPSGSVYQNINTITCKYRVRSIQNPYGANDIIKPARAIVKELKKQQGFTKFEARTYSIQAEESIPLAFGGENEGYKMYWTPALEAEWL